MSEIDQVVIDVDLLGFVYHWGLEINSITVIGESCHAFHTDTYGTFCGMELSDVFHCIRCLSGIILVFLLAIAKYALQLLQKVSSDQSCRYTSGGICTLRRDDHT